jgi:hypothetical protein
MPVATTAQWLASIISSMATFILVGLEPSSLVHHRCEFFEKLFLFTLRTSIPRDGEQRFHRIVKTSPRS